MCALADSTHVDGSPSCQAKACRYRTLLAHCPYNAPAPRLHPLHAMSSQRSTRPFSSTTGVYPAYLPSLHKASRVEKKLVPAAVATLGIGYGIAKYRQSQIDQQHAQQFPTSATDATASRAEALMDAYGDRSSLADMEQAVKAYEAEHARR